MDEGSVGQREPTEQVAITDGADDDIRPAGGLLVGRYRHARDVRAERVTPPLLLTLYELPDESG
jgi:hypothetical protein